LIVVGGDGGIARAVMGCGLRLEGAREFSFRSIAAGTPYRLAKFDDDWFFLSFFLSFFF